MRLLLGLQEDTQRVRKAIRIYATQLASTRQAMSGRCPSVR
jgi:hypothetical protein